MREETWTIDGDTVTIFDECRLPGSVTVLVHTQAAFFACLITDDIQVHGETQAACEDGVQAATDALGVVRQLLKQPIAV